MPEWIEAFLRSISLLIIIFVIAKFIGKRQLSQLTAFEFMIGIIIAVIAAELTLGGVSFVSGFVGLSVWFLIPFLITWLALKSKAIHDFVRGKGTVFIKDGKIMEDNLKKESFTSDDLLQRLRSKNIFQAADVEFAVLEPDGEINVLPKRENQPITPKDVAATVAPIKEPQTVIMDGDIMKEPLATAGLSVNWLHTELEKQGVTIENVYLGQVDNFGQLTLDLFDDKLQVPSPQEKPALLATLKKCQADMEMFALSTENQEAKQMYTKNSQKLQTAIDKMEPLLKS
ncbi:DUF421 domain-containing protein [Aquibacillus albus]|uniref:Uncharacterized membrane protein YcaP (DUF421 family) n=1 Tax=Aquibacillus albus TaxID=1168171 RepID=A0ABS2N238_9BACI|nr:DUF421 domain-containing protein [Aquibacillus albus]MBM7572185.1 uncharacterized membrane protein YcaP (DUF421 family) [Aquibacillus albus]